jgi:hypothetical protein
MATRTTTVVSDPGFVADPHSIMRNDGRQIDWTAVTAGATFGAAGSKRVPAGWKMYYTAAGKLGPTDPTTGAVPAAEALAGILATDAVENSKTAALSGYGVIVGGVIYQDLLPQPTAATANLTSVGTGFVLLPYADDRVS